jgi:hypothetical protein
MENDQFTLYNWQGGDIEYWVDTSPSAGNVKFTMQNNGVFRVHDLSAGVVKTDSVGRMSSQTIGGDVCDTTGTQTLTNKTLTSPRIDTSLNDTNGNELVKVTATSSAVNEITLSNASTGNGPTISSTGDDANIDLTIAPKGSGNLVLDNHTWPNSDGSANQVMTTDGSGNLSFATVDIKTENTVTTTDGTVTTLATISTSSDVTYLVEASIVGRRTDSGSESAGYVFKTLFRNNGGTLTRVSIDKVSIEDTRQWNGDIVVSGTNILIRVTGQTSKTINWKSSHKILSI